MNSKEQMINKETFSLPSGVVQEHGCIYKMKLHETMIVEDANLFTAVLRVPGGWIYRSYDKSSNILSSDFVRWDNEFQPDGEGR